MQWWYIGSALPFNGFYGMIRIDGFALLLKAIFLIAAGGKLMWTWYQIPIVFAMLLVFATGLSVLLSSLFVRYRDVEPIWDVVMQALFYGTPILYSLSVVIAQADGGRYAPAAAQSALETIAGTAREALAEMRNTLRDEPGAPLGPQPGAADGERIAA